MTPAQTTAQVLADSHLIDSPIVLSRKSPKLVRSTEAAVPGCESMIHLGRSWKMNEFKYYDIPSPFPTLARGLFTTELGAERRENEGNEDVRHRVVVRGHDKFFNIGQGPSRRSRTPPWTPEDWGFIRTASITLNSTDDVRAFTSSVGETGKWHFKSGTARPSRTSSCAHTSPTRPRRRKGSWNRTVSREQSPYTPRSDFFFKVKFDEPYMMYCDWRGVTGVLLSVRDNLQAGGGEDGAVGAAEEQEVKKGECGYPVLSVVHHVIEEKLNNGANKSLWSCAKAEQINQGSTTGNNKAA
ncbi:hypothetical protein DFP72DRAFT_1079263 [Ephemerocybe angulata]|uniref:Uncharacterized protein n=1 Tax=Ephemerocybe angulata TaxID=980116 RepID=A0A8H6HCK9_9AGAR|nr:hypothetical protein DFP72DRAFT_1079263 [Tulosesus angulatus]